LLTSRRALAPKTSWRMQCRRRPAVFLSRDRNRHCGDHRERPRDVRRATGVCAMHAAVGDFRLVRRRGESAETGRRVCGGLAGRRMRPGWGRDAHAAGDRPTAGDCAGGLGRRPHCPKNLRITGTCATGDAIVFLASSGVQTNGLTLCRRIATKLRAATARRWENGRTYARRC